MDYINGDWVAPLVSLWSTLGIPLKAIKLLPIGIVYLVLQSGYVFRLLRLLFAYCTSSIDVVSETHLYHFLEQYLERDPSNKSRQSLKTVKAHKRFLVQNNGSQPDEIHYSPKFGTQCIVFNKRLFFIVHKSHHEKVWDEDQYKEKEVREIICLGRSADPIKKFLAFVAEAGRKDQQQVTSIYEILGTEWYRAATKASRPLSSVVISGNLKQEIIDNIQNYLSTSYQQRSVSRGLPYRKGILLHGPPGSGKTSFTQALAAHFEMDIYIVHLHKGLNDGHLSILMSSVPPKSLILMEDVDSIGLDRATAAAHEPKRARPDVTFSGLLNAIDGISAPEGSVLIMTSNHHEKLDPALIRPGRIDQKYYFGPLEKEQAGEMFRMMYPEPKNIDLLSQEFMRSLRYENASVAALMTYLRMYEDQPQAAIANLSTFDKILGTYSGISHNI